MGNVTTPDDARLPLPADHTEVTPRTLGPLYRAPLVFLELKNGAVPEPGPPGAPARRAPAEARRGTHAKTSPAQGGGEEMMTNIYIYIEPRSENLTTVRKS